MILSAILLKSGAAPYPPQWSPWFGSSKTTTPTTWGFSDGKNPAKLEMYLLEYEPFKYLIAVPVFPATVHPSISALMPVP